MGRPFLFRWEAEEHDSIVIIIIIIIIIVIIIIIPNTRREGEFYVIFFHVGGRGTYCRIKGQGSLTDTHSRVSRVVQIGTGRRFFKLWKVSSFPWSPTA